MFKVKEKTVSDSDFGEVTLRKNPRCRRPSVKVSPNLKVTVTVPSLFSFRYALSLLDRYRERVKSFLEKQKKKNAARESLPEIDIEKLRKEAKEFLPARLASIAGRYGFVYFGVSIKNNKSNWGSCSAKKHINLNLNLMRVPSPARDYVLVHELCHLRYMNHGPEFHSLLEKTLADFYSSIEDEAYISSIAEIRSSAPSGVPVHRAMQLCLRRFPLR